MTNQVIPEQPSQTPSKCPRNHATVKTTIQIPSKNQISPPKSLIPCADQRDARLWIKIRERKDPSSHSAPPQKRTHVQNRDVAAKTATQMMKATSDMFRPRREGAARIQPFAVVGTERTPAEVLRLSAAPTRPFFSPPFSLCRETYGLGVLHHLPART